MPSLACDLLWLWSRIVEIFKFRSFPDLISSPDIFCNLLIVCKVMYTTVSIHLSISTFKLLLTYPIMNKVNYNRIHYQFTIHTSSFLTFYLALPDMREKDSSSVYVWRITGHIQNFPNHWPFGQVLLEITGSNLVHRFSVNLHVSQRQVDSNFHFPKDKF